MRSGLNPAPQQIVFPRIDVESPAAFVVGLLGGLAKDQALIGMIPANAAVGTQSLVIRIEIKPEQRQTKTALSLKRSMTLCRIAAELSEQRNNVLLEIRYGLRLTLSKTRRGRREDPSPRYD